MLCSRVKLSKKVFKIQNHEIHDNLSLIKNEKNILRLQTGKQFWYYIFIIYTFFLNKGNSITAVRNS